LAIADGNDAVADGLSLIPVVATAIEKIDLFPALVLNSLKQLFQSCFDGLRFEQQQQFRGMSLFR